MNDQNTADGVRVRMIEEGEATGRLAELYDLCKKSLDLPFVPDMFRLVSSRPELLEVVLAGYNSIFNQGYLPRETRELIAAWTSHVCQCPYCVGTHSFFLQAFGGSEELVNAIGAANSPDDLPLDERTRELLRLLGKVSTGANGISGADWQRSLDAGWDADELLEGVFCAALFNFITRMVDALGLGASVDASRISRQELPARPEDRRPVP